MGIEPGSSLGPYSVTAQIGEGGMGDVYRATDTKLKREVAIRVLLSALAAARIASHAFNAKPKSSPR
jgi:serine/threonine protein kinase